MRLHAGFHHFDGPFPAAKVIDWISVPLGVATLRDQFRDVQDDSARYALMSCYFEEKLADFAPYDFAPLKMRRSDKHFRLLELPVQSRQLHPVILGLNDMTVQRWTDLG